MQRGVPDPYRQLGVQRGGNRRRRSRPPIASPGEALPPGRAEGDSTRFLAIQEAYLLLLRPAAAARLGCAARSGSGARRCRSTGTSHASASCQRSMDPRGRRGERSARSHAQLGALVHGTGPPGGAPGRRGAGGGRPQGRAGEGGGGAARGHGQAACQGGPARPQRKPQLPGEAAPPAAVAPRRTWIQTERTRLGASRAATPRAGPTRGPRSACRGGRISRPIARRRRAMREAVGAPIPTRHPGAGLARRRLRTHLRAPRLRPPTRPLLREKAHPGRADRRWTSTADQVAPPGRWPLGGISAEATPTCRVGARLSIAGPRWSRVPRRVRSLRTKSDADRQQTISCGRDPGRLPLPARPSSTAPSLRPSGTGCPTPGRRCRSVGPRPAQTLPWAQPLPPLETPTGNHPQAMFPRPAAPRRGPAPSSVPWRHCS